AIATTGTIRIRTTVMGMATLIPTRRGTRGIGHATTIITGRLGVGTPIPATTIPILTTVIGRRIVTMTTTTILTTTAGTGIGEAGIGTRPPSGLQSLAITATSGSQKLASIVRQKIDSLSTQRTAWCG